MACLLFVARELSKALSSEKSADTVDSSEQVSSLINNEPVEKPENEPLLVVIPEVEQNVFSLMTGGQASDIGWASRTPAAKRVRCIFPDPSLLTFEPVLQKGNVIELALFEDAVFSAEISSMTRYPNGAVGFTAPLQGESKGVVFFSYCDGELRASVEVPGGDDYYVRYNPETKLHYAVQVDREKSEFLEGGDPLIPVDDEVVSDASEQMSADEPEVLADAPPGATIIDVMVVYTPAARSNQGGTSGMNNNIADAMEKANFAHGNSDTQVYLNLVHSAEVTYTENDASKDLTRLKNTGDGHMDDVHGWRDRYGADLICLFEDRDDIGGLGYLLSSPGGNPAYGFCLARVQQTDWTYTVVHEWGHNMGCSHSKTQTIQPWESGDLYTYSAGWQWADTASSAPIGYCSVMTYEDFDDDDIDEYKRVGYFSNPDINYTGNTVNATGHATNGDNARTIRKGRGVIAGYRASPLPPPLISVFPHTNSFETGFNSWHHDRADFEWRRKSGSTPSLYTGPSRADDGDYYAFTEANDHENEVAVLEARFDFSELVSPEINFSCHLYGSPSTMGSIYLETSTDDWESTDTVWSISGNQGNVWVQTNITLSAYVGADNLHLRFRGVVGNSWRSDMALDLIVVREGEISDDIDDDGLPNDWEELYFGGPTNANPSASASNGINTVLEAYIAGFDPTDPDAEFLISVFRPPSSESILQWQNASGRIYRVYWASNLVSGFQILETNLTSGGFTDTVHGTESRGFYKLDVQLAP